MAAPRAIGPERMAAPRAIGPERMAAPRAIGPERMGPFGPSGPGGPGCTEAEHDGARVNRCLDAATRAPRTASALSPSRHAAGIPPKRRSPSRHKYRQR